MIAPSLNHPQSQFACASPPNATAKTARRSSSLDPRRAVTHHHDQVASRGYRALPAARYRLGWSGDLNAIAALRTRIYSGLDFWAATHIVEADHSSAPGHFECFPERNQHVRKSFQSHRSVHATMNGVKTDDVTNFR